MSHRDRNENRGASTRQCTCRWSTWWMSAAPFEHNSGKHSRRFSLNRMPESPMDSASPCSEEGGETIPLHSLDEGRSSAVKTPSHRFSSFGTFAPALEQSDVEAGALCSADGSDSDGHEPPHSSTAMSMWLSLALDGIVASFMLGSPLAPLMCLAFFASSSSISSQGS